MIRRSPCEFYLKFLIVQPDKFSNEQIKETLFELGLDDLGDFYVDRLRKRLKPPTPFYPEEKSHPRSYRFVVTEGIEAACLGLLEFRTALRILERPRLKEFVETMLIAGADCAVIADALVRQRNFRADTRSVEMFKHYFWNVDLLDSLGVRAVLQFRATQAAVHPSEDIKRQFDVFKNAFYNDPRRIAAELPNSPMAAMMAQMRLGLLPARVNLPKLLERTRETAAMKAYEYLNSNGVRDSQRARECADVVRAMTEVLDVVVKPDENLRDELEHIALRVDNTPVVTIHELSDGHHTIDVQPLPKGKEDNGPGQPIEQHVDGDVEAGASDAG